jgi:hypothetical protein
MLAKTCMQGKAAVTFKPILPQFTVRSYRNATSGAEFQGHSVDREGVLLLEFANASTSQVLLLHWGNAAVLVWFDRSLDVRVATTFLLANGRHLPIVRLLSDVHASSAFVGPSGRIRTCFQQNNGHGAKEIHSFINQRVVKLP